MGNASCSVCSAPCRLAAQIWSLPTLSVCLLSLPCSIASERRRAQSMEFAHTFCLPDTTYSPPFSFAVTRPPETRRTASRSSFPRSGRPSLTRLMTKSSEYGDSLLLFWRPLLEVDAVPLQTPSANCIFSHKPPHSQWCYVSPIFHWKLMLFFSKLLPTIWICSPQTPRPPRSRPLSSASFSPGTLSARTRTRSSTPTAPARSTFCLPSTRRLSLPSSPTSSTCCRTFAYV